MENNTNDKLDLILQKLQAFEDRLTRVEQRPDSNHVTQARAENNNILPFTMPEYLVTDPHNSYATTARNFRDKSTYFYNKARYNSNQGKEGRVTKNTGRAYERQIPPQSIHEIRNAPRQPIVICESQEQLNREAPQMPVKPLLPTTENPELEELSSTLFHMVQLQRALGNWETIPIAIGKKIDKLFKDICPPRPNEELRHKLDLIKSDTKSNLVLTVQDHIMNQVHAEDSTLKKFNPVHKTEAKQTAFFHLKHRYGQKLDEPETRRLLAQAIERVGLDRAAETETEVLTHRVSEPAEASLNNDLTTTAQINEESNRRIPGPAITASIFATTNERKRTYQVVSPDIPVSNQFGVLDDDDDISFMGEHQNGENQNIRPEPKKINKGPSPGTGKRITQGSQETPIRKTEKCIQATESTATIGRAPNTKEAAVPYGSPKESLDNTSNRNVLSVTNASAIPSVQLDFSDMESDFEPQQSSAYLEEREANLIDTSRESFMSEPATTSTSAEPVAAHRMDLSQNVRAKPTVHHKGNKFAWKLCVKKDAKVLVLADSNFRHAYNLPTTWDIHVFPGMNMEWATKILKKAELHLNHTLETIITHVGVNNRNYAEKANNVEIGKLTTALKETRKIIYFNGISYSSTLSSKYQTALADLNTRALKRFGERFIQPLPTHQVSTYPWDVDKIHYDQPTLDQVCQNIVNHFLNIPRKLKLPM